MGIFDSIGRLFTGRKKPTLKQLSLDVLRREQITIQNELRKLEIENEKNEREEYRLKGEYKEAHESNRDALKRSIARKLQNIALRHRGLEARLGHTNKMYQTLTGMLIIKENMAFFEKLGVGSVICDMDLGELESFVTEATIEGTLRQEKLAAMLQGVDVGVEQIAGIAQEASLHDFMAGLDAELIGSPYEKDKKKTDLLDIGALEAVVTKEPAVVRERRQNE